ncbi:hypothetical protein QA802_38805 [Streptomyces sp. B21-105]|uniref:hypothetical protein n=1 Tax=Streptomyces sp. B21-105 TaxID=3039417 RepID=UPI002FF2150F
MPGDRPAYPRVGILDEGPAFGGLEVLPARDLPPDLRIRVAGQQGHDVGRKTGFLAIIDRSSGPAGAVRTPSTTALLSARWSRASVRAWQECGGRTLSTHAGSSSRALRSALSRTSSSGSASRAARVRAGRELQGPVPQSRTFATGCVDIDLSNAADICR